MRLLLCYLTCVALALAQTATLRGIITDESGAVIPAAKVTLRGPSNQVKTVTAGTDGSYTFAGLPAGDYTIAAAAPELAMPQPLQVALRGGVQTVNLQL